MSPTVALILPALVLTAATAHAQSATSAPTTAPAESTAAADLTAPAAISAPASAPVGPSFAELIAMTDDERDDVLKNGVAPDLDGLVGWEFRGYNPPFFARLLGFQKFIKGFARDAEGKVYGYNLFVEDARGGPDAPWVARGDGGPDTRHGFYDLVPLDPATGVDGVLLDYGSGRNAWYNPEGLIRDQLVQVTPGNPDLLLGKAFLQIGPGRVYSNFFVLERLRRAPDAP